LGLTILLSAFETPIQSEEESSGKKDRLRYLSESASTMPKKSKR